MIVYLYRWKLHADKVEQFREAWSIVTDRLRTQHGSLGSRLHAGSDGLWYGYAQWPSSEAREAATLDDPAALDARRRMRDATIDSMPEVVLTPLADYLILPSPADE